MSTGQVDDFYSDCYSSFSQVTSTTINDIDQIPYQLTFRTATIFISATVGGLLFGYDTGVISGVLLNIKPTDIKLALLTDFDRELITSSTSIGSFFGSIIAYKLADHYGRKYSLAICCVVFVIAAILLSMANSFCILIVGRLIVGIAVGVAAQCVPIYLSEISPARIRGFMLTLNSIAITGGQLLSYVIAYYLRDWKYAWRYLFGISAIPSLVFILLLDFIPESPRWLAHTKQYSKAQTSLRMIYPSASPLQVNLKLRKLILALNKIERYTEIEPESTTSTTPLLTRQGTSNRTSFSLSNTTKITKPKKLPIVVTKMEPKTRRALTVGCILMFFQQISGFNAFMYYSPLIFSNFETENPLIPAMVIAATNFLFTFVALGLVDSLGRRSILLYTVWIMIVGLLLASIGFNHNNVNLLLTSLIIYVAGYASALGTIPWSSVEFLPLNRRSFGASCISCTNWLTNALVSISYLSVTKWIGYENTMLGFAFFMLMAWAFVYFWYPEVKGLSLEEIGKVFENGIDVHYIYRNYH